MCGWGSGKMASLKPLVSRVFLQTVRRYSTNEVGLSFDADANLHMLFMCS